MTHADKIRAMTDEELAGYFFEICPPERAFCPKDKGANVTCQGCWLDWLEAETEEDKDG